MDRAAELREGFEDLVVGEELRPGRHARPRAEAGRVGDADGGVWGQVEDRVGDVGETTVLGDAEVLGDWDRVRRVFLALPDESGGQGCDEGVGQQGAELRDGPAAAHGHRGLQPPGRVGAYGGDGFRQAAEPDAGGFGEFGVVVGGRVGQVRVRGAFGVGDRGMAVLVERGVEAAGAVAQPGGRVLVEAEVGDQAVEELLGGLASRGGEVGELLLGAVGEGAAGGGAGDAVQLEPGLVGAEVGEDFEGRRCALVAALARPAEDQGDEAAQGLGVADLALGGQDPRRLGRVVAGPPGGEQRSAERREGGRVRQLPDDCQARVGLTGPAEGEHREDVPRGRLGQCRAAVAQQDLWQVGLTEPVGELRGAGG